ncbi:hypothetical protein GCM10027294_14720 [Marinactinospora endophytica]
MLLNRISLRAAGAVGAAVLVGGGAFAISAFADSGTPPEQAASAALPQPSETASTASFFPEAQELPAEEREARINEARAQRDEASGAASIRAAVSVQAEKEEPEEEEEPAGEESTDDGGAPAPSGDPKAIAQAMLADYGWGSDQFSCLEPLWEKESNWNPSAQNPSSGAYGIPQALPGDKMASAGSDWQTNPATQIKWGLGYISDRYGTPCGAWEHSQANNWY